MPKPVPPSLRRFLACALPACVLSLLAQRAALAQRPGNALPPSSTPSPTDDYYRGQAPYPTGKPTDSPTAPPPQDQAPQLPSAPGASQGSGAADDTLAAFLRSEAGGAPLKLSQARAGWRSMRIVRSGQVGSGQAGATRIERGGASVSSGLPWSRIVSRFAGEPDTFLTRGRTIKLNGDDHLLVYQAQFPSAAEIERWMSTRFPRGSGAGSGAGAPGSPSAAPSLSDWTSAMRTFLGAIPLRASIINTRQVAAMEDIEPFDFQSRFALFSRDLGEAFREFQARPSTGTTPSTGTSPGSQEPGSGQILPPARIPVPPAIPSTPRETEPGLAEEPPRAVPVPDAVAQQAAGEPLRRLFAAVQRYRADNGDVLPPLDDLTRAQAALASYLGGQDPWRDPVSGRFFVPNARLSARRMVHLKPFASSLILFYSEADASGRRTVLRLDGIIRRVSPGEWEKLNGTAGVQ